MGLPAGYGGRAVTGAISGAASGAATGTTVMPGWGTLIGAGVGAASSLIGSGMQGAAESEMYDEARSDKLKQQSFENDMLVKSFQQREKEMKAQRYQMFRDGLLKALGAL